MGIGPDSELTVSTVAADYLLANKAVMSKGEDGKTTSINGGNILTEKVEVTGKTVTNTLLAAESITSRGTIHADSSVSAPGVSATLFSGGSFKGSNVDAGFITAEKWIKTPALQVNGTQVLLRQM